LRDLATATLGQALASPSAVLKLAAIAAIEEIEIQDLATDVAARMGDDDDRVSAAAAIAILHGGYEQAPGVAYERMTSEDAEARRIAVEGVGKKVGLRAAADLEKAASDTDARVRRAAVYWLGQIKDRDAVAVLAQRMKDEDEGVRAAAARAMARIGIGDLGAFGKAAAADKALAVRLAAIDLFVAAHADAELAQLAHDPDPMVAAEAAIAAHAPDLARDAVTRALASPDWAIRAGAANILSRALAKPEAIDAARKLTADTALGVRLAAARVLAHAGDVADAAPVFVAALGADDAQDHAAQAAADLAAIDDPRGLARLDELVRDPKRTAEARAAAAEAHRTAHHVTPGLVAALADNNAIVRVAAAATIGVLAKSRD
jgi:HEAT repeat protein